MAMKKNFLDKLHTNGLYYLIGSLLLLIGIPTYQWLILLPQGYSNALAYASKGSFVSYLAWIGNHLGQFLGYRVLLMIAFAFLISLPFTLFRIIVAQEILGPEENEEPEADVTEATGAENELEGEEADKKDEMPVDA